MPGPWIDISYTIYNGCPQWPLDHKLKMSRYAEIGPDSAAQITRLDWISHFMTHVDAPAHFIAGGKGVADFSLDHWSGEAIVVAVDGDAIEERHIPEICQGLCILFKTRNAELWKSSEFREDYVYVSGPAARLLAARGAKLVGVDYMSIDQYTNKETPAHYSLLGADIVLLEAINLSEIEPGRYELVAFPLKIDDCDGSPVRAALRKLD